MATFPPGSIICTILRGPYLFNFVFSIGFSVWAYSSLDAIDGKQARRTGQSGPLGELFDHGCDAVNLALMNLIFPLIFALEINGLFIAAVFILLLGFYVVTWDEYHTHTLYLTIISGPVEGTIIFTIAAVLSGWFGSSLWLTPAGSSRIPLMAAVLGKDTPINAAVPLALLVTGFFTILTSIQRVCQKNSTAIWQMAPFFSFMTSAGICLYLETALWDRLTETILYIGFTFAHATVCPQCFMNS